jgi:hypothetical protein
MQDATNLFEMRNGYECSMAKEMQASMNPKLKACFTGSILDDAADGKMVDGEKDVGLGLGQVASGNPGTGGIGCFSRVAEGTR